MLDSVEVRNGVGFILLDIFIQIKNFYDGVSMACSKSVASA